MIKGKMFMILRLLLCIGFCFVSYSQAMAQKTFILKDFAAWDETIYNLKGSEMYVRLNDSIFFIPKIAPFEFRTTKCIDSLFASNDTLKNVYFLIRNSKYDFTVSITRKVYNKYDRFGMYVYTKGKTKNYRVDLLETDGYGLSSPQLEITPNKDWKEKYYTPDKKPCCP